MPPACPVVLGWYKKKIMDCCGCEDSDGEEETPTTQLREITLQPADMTSVTTGVPVIEDIGNPRVPVQDRYVPGAHLTSGVDRPAGSWY